MVLIFGRAVPDHLYYFLVERVRQYLNALLIIFGILLSVLFLASFVLKHDYNVNVLYISLESPVVHITSKEFLSVALDSSVIANGFKNLNLSDPRLIKLMKPLAPAYLRIGGNMADRLTFVPSSNFSIKYDGESIDGGDCAYASYYCFYRTKPNYTMNGEEWLKLNELARDASFEIIFDLNVLKRFDNGSWNPSNARTLIDFSNTNNLSLHWELGNEPNAFFHEFNTRVRPEQLAKDFKALRNLLDEYPRYRQSLLVGPDVTRPQADHKNSIKYLKEFLLHSGNSISAVTWHQYYWNGRFAKPYNYLDYGLFDILVWEIEKIRNVTSKTGTRKPIWLGETADAWGGGSEELSDTYISIFIWLDKLGLAAKLGLSVVIRQSLVEGYYALIDKNYEPAPSWWISVLYKMFVGQKVIECHLAAIPGLRFYCHCAKSDKRWISVFGMNLQDTTARFRIETERGILSTRVDAYLMTPYISLFSRKISLNGYLLELTEDYDLPDIPPKILPTKPFLVLPPYSVVFLKIPMRSTRTVCHG